MVLKPPEGMALLEVPVQDLKRFVQETETLVPRGSESERTDSDVLLRHLLAEG
ncbi:SsgA family sporulation/cell division regulator [Streptomyces mirabilis]|uniref:SsgA family sporulation/cell division regulator n=1 Tax=Streptomyces TaxID=1883 RepID=UPI00332ACC79